MSVEVMATIIAAASLLVTLGGGMVGGLAWVIRRGDERLDKVNERFDKVNERLDGLHAEVTEVKIAVARLEGPRPHLSLPR